MVHRNDHKALRIFSSLIFSILVLSLPLANAQSTSDQCAKLSSNTDVYSFIMTIYTKLAPFIQQIPGVNIFNPALIPDVNSICTSRLASYSNSGNFASASYACIKQCTKNNSPGGLQCSGTAKAECKADTSVSAVICKPLPQMGTIGSPIGPTTYECSIPGKITVKCDCSGNGEVEQK